MLGEDQLSYGYLYDEHGDPDADATTVGNWNGSAWETYVLIDPITSIVQLDNNGNDPRPDNPLVPENVVALWCNQQDTGDGVAPLYFVTVLACAPIVGNDCVGKCVATSQ